ncbi:unnamed protein product [Paramecium sonneborni]|uniref:Uncharacterized protein n=1 Tax=Paramecium sonneborni TaxID=65129 RepID=A0A8S1M699_9CILI|nr:unnamed protein product [Paramecium sonneborni]
MNLMLSSLIDLKSSNKELNIQEQEVDQLDKNKYKFVKIKIFQKITQDHQIIYEKDGVILRREQLNEASINSELLSNIEQIKYLYWQGQVGLNKKKNGRWIATWNGKALKNVGGYYQDGFKHGQWIDIIKNFNSQAQVIQIGEYYNDIKRGKWYYIYINNKIDGGYYNYEGQKIGKWLDLSDGFWTNQQVIYEGEYNNRGWKKGRWDIMYCQLEAEVFKQIGGGIYVEQEQGSKKIGKWIEQWEGFRAKAQINFIGEYNIKGEKKGRWDFCKVRGTKIGGGSYLEQEIDSSIKIGKWVEFLKGFDVKVTYYGEYNMQGQKVGRWDFCYNWNKQIGGGSYDVQEGDFSIKTGRWVDLWEGFKDDAKVFFNGKYNQSGMKVGRWDILLNYDGKNKQIGGGQYDVQEGGSQKLGIWIELDEDFTQVSQVTLQGEYNNGIKIGLWKMFKNEEFIEYRSAPSETRKMIKSTKNFDIMYYGLLIDNKKVGRWDILYQDQLIGGGVYEILGRDSSIKIGKWIELLEDIKKDQKVTFIGEYNINGEKAGRWDIFLNQNGRNKSIGGGSYYGSLELKIGRWIELWEDFGENRQVTYDGEYNTNGIKIGRWDIFLNQKGQNKLIGGGFFDGSLDIKIGKWIDLWENFAENKQVIYNGEYNTNGRKIGRWKIFLNQNGQNKLIGGGSYDNSLNMKIGQWIELWEGFSTKATVTLAGEYNMQGKKIGKWTFIWDQDKGNQQIMMALQILRQVSGQICGKILRKINKLSIMVNIIQMVGRQVDGRYSQILKEKIYQGNYFYQINFSGGGSYDNSQGIKIGKWTELWDNFEAYKQVTYIGEYNNNGQKVGEWEIWFQQTWGKKESKYIGGGEYDSCLGFQIGRWKESWIGYQGGANIILNGKYNMQGKKAGCWDGFSNFDGQNNLIAGGSYDNFLGIKIGRWRELREGFSYYSQVILIGEYNIQGIKVGRWDIIYKKPNQREFKLIGGGQYDSVSGIKFGQWIELWEKFFEYKEITYHGEYNLKGMKVGRWDIQKNDQLIGGGQYDSILGGKIGRWVELDEGFSNQKQVTYIGEYDKNGMKIGRWDIMYKWRDYDGYQNKNYEKIGNGSYDNSQEIKIGKWVELWENFEYGSQVIYMGEYNMNGMKVGRWDIMFSDSHINQEYKQIGGGLQYTFSVKIGKWIVLSSEFTKWNKKSYQIEYNLNEN